MENQSNLIMIKKNPSLSVLIKIRLIQFCAIIDTQIYYGKSIKFSVSQINFDQFGI